MRLLGILQSFTLIFTQNIGAKCPENVGNLPGKNEATWSFTLRFTQNIGVEYPENVDNLHTWKNEATWNISVIHPEI